MLFEDKARVIGQLWIDFRNDEDFAPFIKYNDLGCPMAYMFSEGMIKELAPEGIRNVEQTFKMFLELFEVSEAEIDSEVSDKNLIGVLTYANRKKGFKRESVF